MLNELASRCDAIEECYEFMLAFAARGVGAEQGSEQSGMIRDQLTRASTALTGIGGAYMDAVQQHDLTPEEPYRAFLNVLERDALDALAAIELALAQPSISSLLIDNLNASLHLRALLTDLFLVDEMFKLRRHAAESQAGVKS